MGFFDWLFGRRTQGGAGVEGDTSDASARPARPARPASPSSPRATDPESALQPLTALLGASRVLSNPDDPTECEVRGAKDGRPARVKLDDRPFLECELKANVGARVIVLCRDPNKVPKRGDAEDPWDDGDVRTFVAKGIYAEGDREQVEGFLRTLDGLSPSARGALLGAMEGCFAGSPIALFVAAGDEVGISGMVSYEGAARDAELCLSALVPIAAEIESLPDPVQAMIDGAGAGSPPGIPSNLAVASCAYCGSRFVTAWGFNCPNCGAPHRG